MIGFSECDDQRGLVGNFRVAHVIIISECSQTFEEKPQIIEKGIEML
jgi:hypothetical protein